METENVYLFDIYSGYSGVVLWFLNENGKKFKIVKPFEPYFFILKTRESQEIIKQLYKNFGEKINVNIENRKDLIKGYVEVFKVKSKNTSVHKKVVSFLKNSPFIEKGEFYNLQISPEQLYMFEKDIFPFFKFTIEKTISGQKKWIRSDSIGKIDYDLPNFQTLYIKFETDFGNPKHLKKLPPIVLKFDDGMEIVVDNDIQYINQIIKKIDPDLIITQYGDSLILPILLKSGVSSLNLDDLAFRSKGISYESYGKIYYRDTSVYLKGRIHIDTKNSFFYNEVGLEGIVEVSRISSIPVQKLSRTALGTPITSIEMKKAFMEGYLIPYKKNLPENEKTAEELLMIDKGGLTYRPLKGIYENVAEYDFFSMYPSIILNYNLSYETINCSHKDCQNKLPYVNYRICTKKLGIVPQVLKFLLLRRAKLKQQKKEARQKALKWLLVVSFGYLGYKNAVFGRIESHEATTAIGRELLITAKEVAEKYNFKFLHGLTDAMWVYREKASQSDYQDLEKVINVVINRKFKGVVKDSIGFKIQLEGIYDWIVFLSSKKEDIGVSNKYYGKFRDGEMKIRGIELRRHDIPDFIKEYQEEVFKILKEAKNKSDLISLKPLIENVTKEYLEKLLLGNFNIEKLIVTKRISKSIEEYQKRTDISETVGTLIKEGIEVYPGENVNILYVKGEKGSPYEIYIKNITKIIDLDKYKKILLESSKTFNFFNIS